MDGYLKSASSNIAVAVQHDQDGNYQEAFTHYMLGLDWFEMARTYAPTERLKTQLAVRM